MPKKSTARSPELESFRTKTSPELITAGNSALAANPNFNYGDGLTAALFAKAAYSHSTSTGSFLTSLGWEPLTPSASSREVKNAYAFAAKRIDASGDAQILISFEGSNSTLDQLGDWVDNVAKYGWSGYYKALQPLFADVIHQALTLKSQGKNVELVVTGHSLGGAAASLAYTDLFLPKSMGIWPDKSAPLELGSRIYDQAALKGWTEAQVRELLASTQLYVFGAPSFLIDPNKLDGWGLLKFGISALNPLSLANFFYDFGKKVVGVLDVDDKKIPSLAGFADNAFQFEHRNSDSLLGLGYLDPVAALGSRQAGTQIAINLTGENYKRYGDSLLSLHSMEFYAESIARAVAGKMITKTADPFSDSGLLLPQFSNGTPQSDRIINASEAFGLAGNDLIIASVPGEFIFNGGTGQDTYVLASYGADITINSPSYENNDFLFIALDGSISKTVDGNDLILRVTGKSPEQVSTVRLEGDTGYDVSFVGVIQMNESAAWTVSAVL